MAKRKTLNIIFPLDSTVGYNDKILESIANSYKSAQVFVPIVGSINKSRELKSKIKDFNPNINCVNLSARGFNYSYTCNLVLNKFAKKINDDDLILFSEPLIYFKFNDNVLDEFVWNMTEEEFIEIPVLKDSLNEPLKTIEGNFPYRVGRKIREMIAASEPITDPEEDRQQIPLSYCTPLIVGSVKTVCRIEKGLDEFLFSNMARTHLGIQLEKIGLKKKQSEYFAYRLSNKMEPHLGRISDDKKYLKEYYKRTEHTVFIPSNFGTDIGDTKRVRGLILNSEKYPAWDNNKNSCVGLPRMIPRATKEIKNLTTSEAREIIEETNKEIKVEKIDSPIPKIIIEGTRLESKITFKEIAILIVQNTTKNSILNTKFVKEIFTRYGPIDILTNNRDAEPIHLMESFMIKNFYDLSDIENGFLDLNRYEFIIKTKDCGIRIHDQFIRKLKLKKKEKPIIDVETFVNIINDPNPYCSYNNPKVALPEQTVVIASSMNKMLFNSPYLAMWDKLNVFASKLSNLKINTILLSLEREKDIMEVERLVKRPNISYHPLAKLRDAAGILNSCSLVITNPYSDTFWLAYGLNKKTLLMVGHERDEYPNAEWITKMTKPCSCVQGPDRCKKKECVTGLSIEEVINQTCRLI